MPQHDYQLANQPGAAFRSDLNAALLAIATQNSGTAAPEPTYAFMPWIDTSGLTATPATAALLKLRNAANSGWVSIGPVDSAFFGAQPFNANIPIVAASLAEMTAGTEAALRSMSPLRVAQAIAALAVTYGVFRKANPDIVAWTRTANFAVATATLIYVEVAGKLITIAAGTAVTMPGTATNGTDYAIWAKPDGTLEATSNHTTPPVANSRKVGGFHYAPGANATANSDGNSTPQINAFSFWDLKFRPACPDPRGMTLVADGFWADIYLLGVDHLVNGTSRFNVTIADGSSPPRIPTKFGGTGSNSYSSLNWWEAAEVMRHHGKRLPTYSEFAALAFGTTEATQRGTDPVSTIWDTAFTSRWGTNQSSGCMWIWGDEFGGGAASAAWSANTGGRGSTYQMENAVVFGGGWGSGAFCGSRSSAWSDSPTNSYNSLGARGVCDHLQLD